MNRLTFVVVLSMLLSLSTVARASEYYVSITIGGTFALYGGGIARQYIIEYSLPSAAYIYGGDEFENAEQIEFNPVGEGSRSVIYRCDNVCSSPRFWVTEGYRGSAQRMFLSDVEIGSYQSNSMDFNYYLFFPAVMR